MKMLFNVLKLFTILVIIGLLVFPAVAQEPEPVQVYTLSENIVIAVMVAVLALLTAFMGTVVYALKYLANSLPSWAAAMASPVKDLVVGEITDYVESTERTDDDIAWAAILARLEAIEAKLQGAVVVGESQDRSTLYPEPEIVVAGDLGDATPTGG